ncbi:MAG TPA: nucleotidyltransferase domain-containing protein [Gemmatimonadaceae bacterium]
MTHFALYPRTDLHFRGLQRATQLPHRSLQLELARLERLGLIARMPDGRLVRYVVPPDEARWHVLRDMVRQFVEPTEILRVALGQVEGVAAAFVYGSFAHRQEVHADSDIDLFVVLSAVDQEPARLSLADVVLEVSGFLGREVNVSRYTPAQLERKLASRSRFVTTVLAGEKEWLIGDERRLRSTLARTARGKVRAASA